MLWQSIKRMFNPLLPKTLPSTCVCLDTETSGLDPEGALLLSIGAVKIKDGVILGEDKFHVIVRPDERYSTETIPIHWLRPRDTEQGIPLMDALAAFSLFIGDLPVVGYHIEFDRRVLERALNRPMSNSFIDVADAYLKRTHQKRLTLAPGDHIDLGFEFICEDLDIPIIERHTALGDALTTALIYLKVMG